ncbi:lipoate--protein ligase [Amphibacillus sp. Q70]|uniref:lipoate--protein ligase n=1 Tax=Amphibacillus sp. Q70 TaxID=3453416 RepID=UPI003F842D0C
MYLVDSRSSNPAINVSVESFLLSNEVVDDTIVFFYQMEPSIGIGRFQNAYEEVNYPYVKEQGIPVIRRASGGGAMFSDPGQIAFCFITKDEGDTFGNFKEFTRPILDALHKMGATDAQLSGRNDLTIDGKKFSGNAMSVKDGRMFAHGTLMIDLDTDQLTKALNPSKEKLRSKGVKSVRSRVTNLRPYFSEQYQNATVEEIKNTILLYVFGVDSLDEIKRYELTEEDWGKINAFKAAVPDNPEWNYGKNPSFDLERQRKFDAGLVQVKFNVAHDKISAIRIFGDFFGKGSIEDVEQVLIDVPYNEEAIQNALESLDIPYYFGKIKIEELAQLIAF